MPKVRACKCKRRGNSSCFLGSATALKPHTLGVRRKQLLACRYLVPTGSGLACTLLLFCLLLSGLPAVTASVVTALGRSACVCSRGAPLHYTSSCCDVGLDSTSPHSLFRSFLRRSPLSPMACGTHSQTTVLLFFSRFFSFCALPACSWCYVSSIGAEGGWVGTKICCLCRYWKLRHGPA